MGGCSSLAPTNKVAKMLAYTGMMSAGNRIFSIPYDIVLLVPVLVRYIKEMEIFYGY